MKWRMFSGAGETGGAVGQVARVLLLADGQAQVFVLG